MAVVFRPTHHPSAPESDYGSDFSTEEASLVIQLLEDLENEPAGDAPDSANRADPDSQADLNAAIADDLFVSSPFGLVSDHVSPAPGPAVLQSAERGSLGQAKTPATTRGNLAIGDIEDQLRPRSMPMDGIEYPDLGRTLTSLDPVTTLPRSSQLEAFKSSAEEKLKSPIERFRSFPKRPLTVTDLSSGAWCELQYWYTLTLLPGGRKTKTAAMRGGTKVHKTLEDQVHTTIRVDVTLKEEAFALRLWNFIQGLRTLRDTGLTRELEVWGVVQGQVINGVIDEVSYTSPNAGFEQELSQSQSSQDDATGHSQKQPSIVNYFEPHRRRVYLTDVKTRGSDTLPSGAAIRPARVQLFLYHRLLREMAAGQLAFSTVIARYGLQPEARFSDAFMAQIGSLHDDIFEDTDANAEGFATDGIPGGYPGPSPGKGSEMTPPPDRMRYRSIQQIIPLVLSELQVTFPQGADTLGDLVAVQYRHRDDGHVIGNQAFPTDQDALSMYLKLNLGWWLGERNPDGVPIEEAYKCGYCEFAERCQWRQDRDDEMVRKSASRSSLAPKT